MLNDEELMLWGWKFEDGIVQGDIKLFVKKGEILERRFEGSTLLDLLIVVGLGLL